MCEICFRSGPLPDLRIAAGGGSGSGSAHPASGAPPLPPTDVVKCAVSGCSRFYHAACAAAHPLTRQTAPVSLLPQLAPLPRFRCPAHACASCRCVRGCSEIVRRAPDPSPPPLCRAPGVAGGAAFAEASATVTAANHASAQKRASRMVGAPPVLPAPSRLLSCARCVNAFHARPRCVPARATPTASPDCLVCPDHSLAPLHSHPVAAHSRLAALWRPSTAAAADSGGADDLLSSRDAQPLPLHLVGRTPVFAAPNSAAIAFGNSLGRAAAEAASTGALVRYVDVQRARAAAISEAVVAGAADAAGFGLRFEAPAGLSPRAAAYAEWEALAGLPEHDLGAAHAAGGLQLSPLQQAVSQALLLQVRAEEGGRGPPVPSLPSPPLAALCQWRRSAGGGDAAACAAPASAALALVWAGQLDAARCCDGRPAGPCWWGPGAERDCLWRCASLCAATWCRSSEGCRPRCAARAAGRPPSAAPARPRHLRHEPGPRSAPRRVPCCRRASARSRAAGGRSGEGAPRCAGRG